jgi:hypothetical protein
MAEIDTDDSTGEIQRAYRITCGVPLCDHTEILDVATKKEARSILYDSGWSHRKNLDWTCPNHDEKTVQYLNQDGRRGMKTREKAENNVGGA